MTDLPILRTCARCRITKVITEFPERAVGSGRRHGHCRACKAQYQKEWYEKNKERHKANVAAIRRVRIRRNRVIIEAAKSAPCMDCGRKFPPYVMDFDHVVGTKRGTIASWYVSISEKALLEEIAKCEVVCANCHRIRTYGRTRMEAHRKGRRAGDMDHAP
jgi:5-methylcytosine-specific restriction endonuclease McrA